MRISDWSSDVCSFDLRSSPKRIPSPNAERTPMPLDPSEEVELLERFGITKAPAYQYHYRDWRYSNLDDAVAQARRDAARSTYSKEPPMAKSQRRSRKKPPTPKKAPLPNQNPHNPSKKAPAEK